MTPKLRACLALVLVMPATLSARPHPFFTEEYRGIDYGAIVRLECQRGTGTAFQFAPGRYITAAHVPAMAGQCFLGEMPVTVVRIDYQLDAAELSGPALPTSLELDCEGLKPSRVHVAVGWALGLYRHSAPLRATTQANQGFRVLQGVVYKGMSGGPIVTKQGKAAGITVHTYAPLPASGGRPLSDTWLCEDKA
jgi:hypothetical protein